MPTATRSPCLPILLAAALAAACTDAPTEPLALVVAAETEAALRVAEALPTLPQVVDRLVAAGRLDPADAATLAAARSLWVEADGVADAASARLLRRRAYAQAAPAVARALGPAGLAEAETGLRRWIELAGAAASGAELPGIAAALADGRALLAAAQSARQRGRSDREAALLLEAADRLRETTPGAVARRLILQAEEALEARRGAAAPGAMERDAAWRRAERLVDGAREALEAGDPVRAIRRAFYARQLLGID
ncbi:MAG TPA: hypothetical protein VF158_00550 [Longimicrobiales bacterium]